MIQNHLLPIPLGWLEETDMLLIEALDRWAEERLISRRQTLGEDHDELLRPALESLARDIGLTQLLWNEEEGTSRSNGGTLALALELVSRADVGIAFLLANTFAIQRLIGSGHSLRQRFEKQETMLIGSFVLPSYGTASKTFHGLAAPLRAKYRSDELLLTADEPIRPQCAGLDADLFCVACELQDAAGPQPALLLLPGDTVGITRGAELKKTGLAASRDTDITLSGVTVPADYCLLTGREAYEDAISWYLLGCSATYQGAMIAAQAILRDWGETRVIKGKGQIFKNNPLVAKQMGAIGARIATCRLQLFGLAQLLSEEGPKGGVPAAAMAVATTTGQSAMDVLDLTMELMASAGYATEWQLERYWRDVKSLQTIVGPAPAREALMARHYFGSEEFSS